jgi:uncharacterized protein YjdB
LKLQAAKEGVSTTFSFPTGTDTKTIEAEAFTLDASGAADANKYVRIQDNSSASGGKEVNWFENGNKIILPFYAAKAGTYKVTATYRSGRDSSNPNALVWSGTHIQAGETTVYGESGAGAYHTVELTIQVTEAGDGELIFTADSRGGPVLDKFTIQAVNQTAAEKVAVTGITLKQETMELTKEQPYGLIFETVLPVNADNTEVTYTSADPSVATVDENGLVMAVANGETVITVTTVDGQKTATCKVTVQMTAASEDNTQETDKPSDNKPSDNTTTDSKPETPSTGTNTGSGTGTGNGTGTGTGTGSSTETPVVKGTTYTDPSGIYTYKVTDVEKRTVEVVKVNAAGKNKKSLKIFNTVTIGGQSYKVTSIGASLFKGNTKITSIIIGKNVTTIGKKAFYGCKNLKKITVKSKVLTKVGAKALKGTNKKLTIKVPKAKKKAYTKLLAKKGQAGTAKIK